MAIRKDLDDMLNSLMDGGGSSSTPARSHTTPRAVRKSRFDNMSVDDLLHALEEEKHHIEDEQAVIPDNTPPASWEFAPPTHEFAPSPESIAPEESPAEEVPNIIAEVMHTEPTAEMTRVFDTVPVSEELPKPAKKKKIVITGELPDYEALRRQEFEREQQAQRAAEAAAEEARAAERARRAAEAAAERQRLAEEAESEEAEKRRLAQEEAERQRRLAEEAEQARLAEEAEKRRLAQEEAERQRRLAEEAEQARLAEEAEKRRLAEEEAERQRRIEEMKRLAEAAEEKAPAPVTFAEETIVNSSAEEAVDAAIEALGEAAAAPAEEMAEAAAETAKPKKISLFKKLKNKGKDEPKPDTEAAPEDGLFEPAEEPSATDLIDAAIAAIHDEEVSHESDPVGSMLENIREDAAEAIADMNETKAEEPENTSSEPLIMSDEDIISGLTPDLKERFDALPADKQQQVIEMRRAQMGAIAPPIVIDEPEEDILPDEDIAPEEPETAEKAEETAPEKPEDEEKPAEAAPVKEEKPKGKVTSALERILDEDPDELIAQRRENVESSSDEPAKDPNRKKLLYTILGVVMTAFAIIGIIATVFKGIGLARSFTSGEVKKDSFTQMVYPAVIMDIEPFSDPSQLTSEQIVTATIWSIIMDDSKISKYDATLDTVTIPDVDVEKYAVELFGENIPQFNHCTVGPVESRFYYSDGAYNVKVKPITHTYAPEVKSIVKNGSEYTLTVDYIAELPTWMEKNVAKQAEYKLTEKEDGTFRFNSMKIISVNSGNI